MKFSLPLVRVVTALLVTVLAFGVLAGPAAAEPGRKSARAAAVETDSIIIEDNVIGKAPDFIGVIDVTGSRGADARCDFIVIDDLVLRDGFIIIVDDLIERARAAQIDFIVIDDLVLRGDECRAGSADIVIIDDLIG